MNDILIIGAGELGKALDFVLKTNTNNKTCFWDGDKNKVANWQPLDQLVINKEIIFLAIPTKAISEVVGKIQTKTNTVLVILSKGLTDQGKTPLETAQEKWSGSIVNISGPMIAEEITQGKKTEAMIAGGDSQAVDQITAIFENTSLALEKTDDLIGLSWSGPLKNVYAVGLGMTQDRGNNHRGCFISQAVKEMGKIIEFLGGKKETAFSLAGIGDLIATGFSPDSSNFQLGVKLAREEKVEKITEGVTAAAGIQKRLVEKLNDWPLVAQIVAKTSKFYN